jgi:hypothetical protein
MRPNKEALSLLMIICVGEADELVSAVIMWD